MSSALEMILLETAKLGLQIWFNYMRIANKTEEELDAIYNKEKELIFKNKPNNLPEV